MPSLSAGFILSQICIFYFSCELSGKAPQPESNGFDQFGVNITQTQLIEMILEGA